MSEKNKAISLVTLVLLVLSLAFLYQGISYSNKALEQSIEVAEESMHATFLSVQDFSFAPYESRIKTFVQTHPQIVEAFVQRDRELLYQLVLPRYRGLQTENEYFHVMHFHLPDATTFLRMHQPELYGDYLKNVRPIVDAVHETKKMLTGFEVGRHGPFYRIVYPIFYQDTYVGALEFGLQVHEVLESLQNRIPYVATSFFNKKEWSKITNFPEDQEITFGRYVLATHGNPIFNKLPSDNSLGSGDRQITIDHKEYIVHPHPLFKNYQGESIGGFVVLQDISFLVTAKNDFIVKAVLFTSVLLVLSFLILYFTFGKMIARLVSAEKYASKAKKEWERTFDAVPDMISILDGQHRIIRANKAMAENLGMPIQEIIYTKCYKIVHGMDKPPSFCPHAKLLKDHQAYSTEVFDEYLQRYLAITVSPLDDSEGDFFGSVHIARDITEQKRVEQERIAAEEKLQKAEKMEAIGLMASGVAHDLNNILSGVVSYPELLLMQLASDDKLYEPIQAIQDSGKRAAAVVADLLTVARGVATVKEIISPNILIEDYFGSSEFKKLKSQHPKVNIQAQLAEDIWNIRCSSVHIQKVVMNLIINAVEAIEVEGKVLVSTANQNVDSATVAASSIAAGEYVVLTIQDTGSGIAKHDLERIFEPFYTKKVMGRSGTGLGLAVVWSTMKDHGASIQVESDNTGSTFTLYFPPCRERVIQQKADIDIASLKGNGTILVVDDDEQQLDIASRMLTMLGYVIDTVSSGEAAVAFCRKSPVDLVLLDMLMEPGINGMETYRQIIEFSPFQKAVIVSGFSENSSILGAKALGVGSFVKKPYSIEQLGKAVQKELAG
jgi:PAS domain S-box-containing protein